MVGSVQDAIRRAIEEGKATPDAARDIQGILDSAGVSTNNPYYSTAVFRTNAHDAYLTASFEEMRHPDVRDAFTAWEYLAIVDGRARPHHAAKHGKLYPSSASFAEVRGTEEKDAINCRCNFRPITVEEMEELRAQDRHIESVW